jgi:thiamine biosynthesis protein ThiI
MAEVPGVNTVLIGLKCERDIDSIEAAALEVLSEHPEFATFAIASKRSNTDFPISSAEINRRLGDSVRVTMGATVDLKAPDVTVNVLVVQGHAFVSVSRVAGVGGLPVGTAGNLVSLLSSGIDSPVATWRMMRRGAVVTGVHFSGRPQVSAESERLVAEIGQVLARTGALGRIYIVPFGDIQREVSLMVPPDLRVLIYRRMMISVAERIAREERAKAIVTGESLGQVASQTLDNIVAVDEVSSLPVLRPLIGNDKLEIMTEARRMGTYDISIRDAEDCCTLFMPRTPETHARLRDVKAAWEAVPHARMVDDALSILEWVDFSSPAYKPPARWPSHSGAAERRAPSGSDGDS